MLSHSPLPQKLLAWTALGLAVSFVVSITLFS